MALSKTFASGTPLTAADVNAHLAHQVPNNGDVYDTGWLPLTVSSGFTGTGLEYRRIGLVVHLRGAITRNAGAFPVGTTAVGTLPAGARPSAFGRYAAAAAPSSTAMIPMLQIDAGGAMSVLVSGTAVSTAIYVDGISYVSA